MAASSWRSPNPITGANIFGQFVNADGTLSGSNIDVDIGAGDQNEPAVAQRVEGGAVVVWTDAGGANPEIHYATVSSLGVVGAEQTVLSEAGIALLRPTLRRSPTVARSSSLRIGGPPLMSYSGSSTRPGTRWALEGFIDEGPADQFVPAVAASANTALVVYLAEIGPMTSTSRPVSSTGPALPLRSRSTIPGIWTSPM